VHFDFKLWWLTFDDLGIDVIWITPFVISSASLLLKPLWGCTSLLWMSLCFMQQSIHQPGFSQATTRFSALDR